MGIASAPAPNITEKPAAADKLAGGTSSSCSNRKFTRLHGLFLSLAIGVGIYLVPTSLPPKAQLAMAIAFFTVAMWVCNVLAIELTAILFCVLIAVCKVLPPARAFAGFSDVTPWFMVAVLAFGVAVTDTGLGKRLSLHLSKVFGTSFTGMLVAMILTGFILTFLTPAGVERVLIVYPLAIGAAVAIMGDKMAGSNVTKLSLSVAYLAGNNFGYGILTGTSANMVAVGVVRQVTGHSLLWMEWAKWFFVPVAFSTLASIYILYKMYPPEQTKLIGGPVKVKEELAAMGPMSSREKRTLLYLSLALLFWVTDAWHGIPPWAVAVFVAVLMNAPGIGCLEIADLKKIPVSICLYSAGTISLGVVMDQTGVSTWLGKATLGHLITPGMSASVMSVITFLVSAVLHFPLIDCKTALTGLVPVVAGYFHAAGMPVMGPTMLCTMSGLLIAFVPFMVLPGVLMIGFGPHFSYKHCTITVSVFSVVSIVVQILCCFTWYRWTGLM